ncbi:exonuclease [Raphidocelis subcapitata]|uniref:Exonuclease n=1 Tax=Raphidocelis subcapitata TaxID=307507 RepID=A0A2V0P8Y8_9CHLO|nr:exonuclease [Raphidocelis subcapitata]|eukprot:GBF96324.1 exonuclease [Raphidocelis subcapitata]
MSVPTARSPNFPAGLAAAAFLAGFVACKIQERFMRWIRFRGALRIKSRPLVTLDLETTGLRPAADRIIEIAAIKVLPDGCTIVKGPQRVDPRMPISPESQRITGIADADVAGAAPRWEEVAGEWREFLQGCVLHGYNARRFDVPVLRAEFGRAGIPNFPPLGTPVVDSCRIFFAKEQRTLTAALAHYCGRRLEGAHGALADTQAALDVLRAQVQRYPDLPRSPEALAAWCSAGRNGDATWDGKFRWSGDSIIFGWGRLQGQPLSAAAVEERDHLLWLKEQDLADETLLLVTDALAGVVHDRASLAARFAGAAAAAVPVAAG